jgi:hypothetical protein
MAFHIGQRLARDAGKTLDPRRPLEIELGCPVAWFS